MSNTMYSATLNTRLSNSTQAVRRLDRLPLNHKDKADQIRRRMTPGAIYGAETSQPTEAKQQAYTTAIKGISNEVQHKDTDATLPRPATAQTWTPKLPSTQIGCQ